MLLSSAAERRARARGLCAGVPTPYVAPETIHTRCLIAIGSTKEIAMKHDLIEEGWKRFLDRLKELWGKLTDPPPFAVWTK